jgi:hypothetical protein
VALLAGLRPATAQGQTRLSVRLSPAATDRFPGISVFASVSDASGQRIGDLGAANFSVLEDAKPVALTAFDQADVGTRQVFVINTNAGLKTRDAAGRSRYDLVREALVAWLQRPDAGLFGLDDLSLITGDGPLTMHRPAAAELASALDGFEPSFNPISTGQDLLLSALEAAGSPPPRPGMPSFLTFFTALPETVDELPLTNTLARARQAGITIYFVLLAPTEALSAPQAAPLRQMAEATGGALLLFDPAAGLSSLASLVLAQRTQYLLTYQSTVVSPGTHTIEVKVTTGGVEAVSEPEPFTIDVRAPEVTLVQPPPQVTRRSSDPRLTVDQLPPTSQPIRLLVTFPDGHVRPLASAQLIVDGHIAAEQTSAPYDTLEWDLSNYSATDTHTIQAVVVDALGLKAASTPASVRIEVFPPPQGLAALGLAVGPLLTAVGVLVVGIILAVALLSFGRMRRPSSQTSAPGRRPVLRRAGLRRAEVARGAEAHLVPLNGGEGIPLTGVDLLLGRDASLSTVVLDDTAVSRMHARVIRQAGGSYLIKDQGSVAGTWVNYDQVPEEGRRLSHGDLVTLGRTTFRFRLATEPPPREVRITPASQDTPPPEGQAP